MLRRINKTSVTSLPGQIMAGVEELSDATMSFPFPEADEHLQLFDWDAFATAGVGSEEQPPLQVSDYMTYDGGSQLEDSLASFAVTGQGDQNHPVLPAETSSSMNYEGGVGTARMDPCFRVAFKTEWEKEVLDDGYKWRKYGKKYVKNSPHPRNYYRCSTHGCSVKKRVERDREDSRNVITTYEGVHNHAVPGAVCCPERLHEEEPDSEKLQESNQLTLAAGILSVKGWAELHLCRSEGNPSLH